MTSALMAPVSRRRLLRGGGSLSIALAAGGVLKVFRRDAMAEGTDAVPVNAWVSIAANEEIVVRLAATEMGQGVTTSLPMIVAEELDADWTRVKIEQIAQGPQKVYGNPQTGGILYTAGSSAVEGYFDILRQAGAGARRVLIYSAAEAWKVQPSEVTSEPGAVLHQASGRRLTFGQIASSQIIVTSVPNITESDLKPRSVYRLIGTDVPRLDTPDKVRGATLYSIDVRVPNMAHAAILRAPVEGESMVSVDDAVAKAIPGVLAVVPLDGGLAVVAERWEAALNARDLLKVEWTSSSPFRAANSDKDMADQVAAVADGDQPGIAWESRGDAARAFQSASHVIEAEYRTDYVYHAQMEPLAAVAAVDDDGKGAEIWLGTQSQTVSLGVALQVLDTTPDRIRFHAMQMGGGFGRRTFFARELLRDALILSRAVHRPVKVVWTREDDLKNGWFRPATTHKLRAVLDQDGKVAAWHHRIAAPSIFAFVAPQRLAAADNKDLLVMEGSELSSYRIPNLLAEHVMTERRARISAWRGTGWGHNCYATECFIDELAQAAGVDAVEFRRNLLSENPRALAVLNAVVAMSSYGKPPAGRAHGLSFAGHKRTLGAGVAEVSLDQGTGTIQVHRVWATIDPGIIIHPKNIEAQVEGGIIFGLSGLLKERVTIEAGEVQQSNFSDYEIMRMNEVPDIQVQVIESGAAPSGAGEIGIPMTGAAVANAVAALTGKRLRHMPFTADRVKSALSTGWRGKQERELKQLDPVALHH